MRLTPEPPQDERDLARLVATIQAIAATDPAKAPPCLELLAKLAPPAAPLEQREPREPADAQADAAPGAGARYAARWDGARGGWAVWDSLCGAWVEPPAVGPEDVARGHAEALNQRDCARAQRRWLRAEDRGRGRK